MSEFLDRISKLSPQRLALLADQLNERLQAEERRRRVPLAVVGIGCHLPGGVHDPEGFWDLLRNDVDAISEVPASRWDAAEFYDRNPNRPGKMSTRWGGFIDGHDKFDPKFFGIAPGEAIGMDPQQRLLLETSWEALENAGIVPSSLAGTQTGVFVGLCNGDYGQVALSAPREAITPYLASGLSHAIAAGRISYVLGLQGPSLAVDTSCSASLVAVHLACQSLRLGECNAALAGGVNLILNPDITIALSQSKMMAPDGRCKAFSDSANGFVRAEGCGMIVLKRLPDALRDGNRILALIRGSACNQDGRSSGLTAPNGPSQEAVVTTALADAGLRPEDVDVIEAHGTGTSLGDPIEAEALNAVFSSSSTRPEALFVGSVKTNLGHLESAAGIAGLIKMVLSLQHGEIPASLHAGKPSSRIDWKRLPMEVPTELRTWNRRGKTRIGGVSSFGFSGTNAHVILEEYSAPTVAALKDDGVPLLFMLSGKTSSALTQVSARLDRHLRNHPKLTPADVARTLNVGRSHFEFRAAFIAVSQGELLERLQGVSSNTESDEILVGRAGGHPPRVAFVFGGEYWKPSAGKELFERAPVFREAIERCGKIIQADLDKPLTSLMYAEGALAGGGNPKLDAVSQKAADFAFHFALAELWRACGIEPSAVLGCGAGEYVAATVAGLFTLEDGLQFAMGRALQDDRDPHYGEPRIPLMLDGGQEHIRSVEYWLRRGDVALSPDRALSLLRSDNPTASLYIGDDDALRLFSKHAERQSHGRWVAWLSHAGNECAGFLNAAAALYVLGCDLDMNAFYRRASNPISLPTYPFEKERYWIDIGTGRGLGAGAVSGTKHVAIEAGGEESDGWVYDLKWEPKPLVGESKKTAAALDEELLAEISLTPASRELIRAAELAGTAMPVYSAFILEAMQSAGLVPLPEDTFTIEELRQRMNVVPARQRVLMRLLDILIEDKVVLRTNGRFQFAELHPRSDAERELGQLAIAFPEFATELNILRRCGKKLLAVLQGEYDPMQLVFADGSVEEAEHIYEHSAVCCFFNDKAARVIRSAIDPITDRPARVLEIGAGTGATTKTILPALAGKDFEYTFTDVSGVFLTRARSKFAHISGMVYRLLDVDNNPVDQGFEAGGYDIILAANVLHATADLHRTIAHARTLLAPGGVIVLIEGVLPDRWLDLTFGLTDGWFRFTDFDLRPNHPLISAERWADVLRDSGMSACRSIAYVTEDGTLSQQRVIVGQVDKEEMLPATAAAKSDREWLILADKSGVGAELHKSLVFAGEACEIVPRPDKAGALASLFHGIESRAKTNTLEIVYLWSLDIAGAIESVSELSVAQELCSVTLAQLVRSLLRGNSSVRLSIATRGAQAMENFSPSAGGSIQSIAWGVGRVLSAEAPEFYRALIDLDPALEPEDSAACLLKELSTHDGEDQVAYRGSRRLVARLRHSQLEKTSEKSPGLTGLRHDGAYLLVGGLGGVGLQVAKWAAEQRPGHLVLLGRSGAGRDASTFSAVRTSVIEEIQRLGVKVTIVEGDVASASDMNALFQRFDGEFPPLRGVFHMATVVDAADLSQLTDEQIRAMLRPKVSGMWILHELTRQIALDFFIAFSSTTSLLGSKGMAHYAAANQFLDSFAHFRRAAGLPMLSVIWGAWDAMRLVSSSDQAMLTETGLLPMPSGEALGFLPYLIASRRAQVMIANIDWSVLKPLFEVKKRRPLLEEFNRVPAHEWSGVSASVPTAACLQSAIGMAPEDGREFIQAFVQEQAARILGFRDGDLPPVEAALSDLGLDSLMAVDLKNRLQAGLGQYLSPTVVFDYPTVSDLVAMLETMLWARHGSTEETLASAHEDVIRI
jgi:acyl transferase domain-containing protein/SAM-dependent methyltransferase/acyl carrier protein